MSALSECQWFGGLDADQDFNGPPLGGQGGGEGGEDDGGQVHSGSFRGEERSVNGPRLKGRACDTVVLNRRENLGHLRFSLPADTAT